MTAEIARYIPQEPAEYVPRFVLDPVQAKKLDQQLRHAMLAVLKENHDYGKIPGAEKPSLWQPGAEKLLQWFGYGFTMDRTEIERDEDGQRLGVTYKCTIIKELPGRRITIAASDGYAGYDEEKYYQAAETLKAKAEKKERYWAEKDGRQPNPAKWEYQVYADYRAPWNTIIKMAQKRALVSAAKDATGAGALFTEDLEDTRDASPPEDTPDPSPPAPPAETARRPRQGRSAAGGEARTKDEDPAAVIVQHFARLGVTDTGDRLILASQILRLDEIPADITDLTADDQRTLRAELSRARNLDKLNELISDGVTPDDAQEEAGDD